MVSLEQKRKYVFYNSIEYLGFIPKDERERIKFDLNNSSNTKLTEVQNNNNITDNQLHLIYDEMVQRTETPQTHSDIWGIGFDIVGSFKNNIDRNLNAELKFV